MTRLSTWLEERHGCSSQKIGFFVASIGRCSAALDCGRAFHIGAQVHRRGKGAEPFFCPVRRIAKFTLPAKVLAGSIIDISPFIRYSYVGLPGDVIGAFPLSYRVRSCLRSTLFLHGGYHVEPLKQSKSDCL